MIEEQATVVSVDGDFVWVESIRLSTCNSCSAQKGCGQSAIAKLGSQERQQFKVLLNDHHLIAGDSITIAIPDEVFLKLSMTVYFVPLMGLIVGASIGFSLFGELLSILMGVAGLASGFYALKQINERNSHNPEYQPQVLYQHRSGEYLPLRIIE